MPAAAGSLAVPIENLGELIAASVTFTAAVGAATPSDRVHYHANEEDLISNQLERPFAILWFENYGYAPVGEGDGYYLQAGGVIVCKLQFESDESDPDDQAIDALNFFGQVIDDVAAVSGSDENLPFDAVDQVQMPKRMSREMRESHGMDFWEAIYRFQYGHR